MKHLQPYKQTTDYSCGPVSLKMAANYFGVDASEEELIKLTGATPALGSTPADLVRAAQKLGLIAEYIPTSSLAEIEKLMDAGAMIIVDWFSPDADGHYSVVSELTATHITLADPTHGAYRTMTRSDFVNRWFELDSYPPKDVSKFFLREAISIRPPKNKG